VRALAVHQAFIGGGTRYFRRSLNLALKMVGGEISPHGSMSLDLWSTLAILVPVFSSTFASFGRCFATIPTGGIGWLIVDEAGQAVPQHAVGALIVAKRALVVGDPLQVEPLITLDEEVDRILLERRDAHPIHRSTTTSMQVLVDRNNTFSTWIAGGDEKVRVGSPLVVHRRCVARCSPFQTLLLTAAAWSLPTARSRRRGGSPRATRPAGIPSRPLLGPSRSIAIPTDRAARALHASARQNGGDYANSWSGAGRECATRRASGSLYISSFRTVANGFRELLSSRRGWWAPDVPRKTVRAWLSSCVGTAHTFQGKEAEAVVLPLGGKTAGAIHWAASTPNILNYLLRARSGGSTSSATGMLGCESRASAPLWVALKASALRLTRFGQARYLRRKTLVFEAGRQLAPGRVGSLEDLADWDAIASFAGRRACDPPTILPLFMRYRRAISTAASG
jgi:hypothetical protein